MPIKFSLLVPSYNRPEYIEETVQSLIKNSGPEVEIIIADDASPKQAEIHAKLEKWINTGEIKWIGHSKNQGWSRNRNSLVQAAVGEYVVLLGDDDRLKPNAINSLTKIIEQNPTIGVFGIGYDIIDEIGTRVLQFCPAKPIKYKLNSGNAWKELFYYDALPMWTHHPFTVCCRRDLARKFPYNPEVDIGDDVLFLFELIASGETLLATGLNLFEWRNSFNVNGQYANLSSNSSRSTRARRLVWFHMLSSSNAPESILKLLNDEKMVRRFLDLEAMEARHVQKVIKSDREEALEHLLQYPEKKLDQQVASKAMRHMRALRYLGVTYPVLLLINKYLRLKYLQTRH